MISKQVKEQKMCEKIESEKQNSDVEWNISYNYLFGLIGVITAVSSLYYSRKRYQLESTQI